MIAPKGPKEAKTTDAAHLPAAPQRVLAVPGSGGASPASGSIPSSDRAAIGLALSRFEERRFGALPPPPRAGTRGPFTPSKAPFCRVEALSFDGDDEALRYALAAGAARAAHAEDPWHEGFEVALVGEAGAAPWGDGLAAVLAEARDAALVLDVLDVELQHGAVRILRDLGRGEKELFTAVGPVVLAVSPEAHRPRYVGRRRWRSVAYERIGHESPAMRAHRDRIDRIAHPDGSGWQPARPRTHGAPHGPTQTSGARRMNEIFGLAGQAQQSEDSHIVQADAETCARHLLRFLSHHGYVGGVKMAAPEEAAAASAAAEPAAAGAPTSETPEGALPARLRRGPRPRGGPARGMHRRPRPVSRPRKESPGDA